METFLKNATVMIDGKRTPYYAVCPDQRPYSWNKMVNTVITTVDDALKKTGLSPQHDPPVGCPEEYCPPVKTIF